MAGRLAEPVVPEKPGLKTFQRRLQENVWWSNLPVLVALGLVGRQSFFTGRTALSPLPPKAHSHAMAPRWDTGQTR